MYGSLFHARLNSNRFLASLLRLYFRIGEDALIILANLFGVGVKLHGRKGLMIMIDCDGLIDMLQAFIESIVFVDGHAGVIILVYLVKVLQLLDLLVTLFDVLSEIKIGHISDHSDQMRPVFLLLKVLLLSVSCDAVFFIPVLQFILVSAHFVDECAEVVMVSSVGRRIEGDGLGAGRTGGLGHWFDEDCGSGEGAYVWSEHLIVCLFFQDFGAFADMRMRSPSIILILIKGKIHLPSIFLFQLPVFIIDLEASIDLRERRLPGAFQLSLKLLLKVDFGLILELILQLFHFEHSFGVDHLPFQFHQLAQKDIFRRDAFLKEIFKVLLVLLDKVILSGGGVLRSEDFLRVT